MSISTFSLFFVLASVNANGENMHKFESVLSNSGAAFDRIVSNQTIDCVKETMNLYESNKELAKVLVNGKLLDSICSSEKICDLEGTDKYNKTEIECDRGGGKIVNQEISKCGQDWCVESGCTDVNIPADTHFVNVPICMAKTCADNANYEDLLAVFSAISKPSAQPNMLRLVVAGNCTSPSSAPSTVPSGKPSTDPSSNPSTTPSNAPSTSPSNAPSTSPSSMPSSTPSNAPSTSPSSVPSSMPSIAPSATNDNSKSGRSSNGHGHEVGGANTVGTGIVEHGNDSVAQIRSSTYSFVTASTIVGILFSVI